MSVFLCRNQQADSKIYGEMQKLWHSKEAQHKGLTLSFLLIIELESDIRVRTNKPMGQNMNWKQIHKYVCAGVALGNSKGKTEF